MPAGMEQHTEQDYRRFLKAAGYNEADAKALAADMVERDTTATDAMIAHRQEQERTLGVPRREY